FIANLLAFFPGDFVADINQLDLIHGPGTSPRINRRGKSDGAGGVRRERGIDGAGVEQWSKLPPAITDAEIDGTAYPLGDGSRRAHTVGDLRLDKSGGPPVNGPVQLARAGIEGGEHQTFDEVAPVRRRARHHREGRQRNHRQVRPKSKPLHHAKSDPQPGEGTGPRREGNGIHGRERDPRLGEQGVHHGQYQPGVLPGSCHELLANLAVNGKGHGTGRGGGINCKECRHGPGACKKIPRRGGGFLISGVMLQHQASGVAGAAALALGGRPRRLGAPAGAAAGLAAFAGRPGRLAAGFAAAGFAAAALGGRPRLATGLALASDLGARVALAALGLRVDVDSLTMVLTLDSRDFFTFRALSASFWAMLLSFLISRALRALSQPASNLAMAELRSLRARASSFFSTSATFAAALCSAATALARVSWTRCSTFALRRSCLRALTWAAASRTAARALITAALA